MLSDVCPQNTGGCEGFVAVHALVRTFSAVNLSKQNKHCLVLNQWHDQPNKKCFLSVWQFSTIMQPTQNRTHHPTKQSSASQSLNQLISQQTAIPTSPLGNIYCSKIETLFSDIFRASNVVWQCTSIRPNSPLTFLVPRLTPKQTRLEQARETCSRQKEGPLQKCVSCFRHSAGEGGHPSANDSHPDPVYMPKRCWAVINSLWGHTRYWYVSLS